jgi:ribosomal protein S20
LEIRNSSLGSAYRGFHKQIRDAWRSGRRDAQAEQQIKTVVTELKHRIQVSPQSSPT